MKQNIRKGVKYMHNDDKKYSEIDPGMQKDEGSKGGKSQNHQDDTGNFANDPQKERESGQKGGKASQQGGQGHQLTEEERMKGGSHSGGNFQNDPYNKSDMEE